LHGSTGLLRCARNDGRRGSREGAKKKEGAKGLHFQIHC
jgi:hypothetical protein